MTGSGRPRASAPVRDSPTAQRSLGSVSLIALTLLLQLYPHRVGHRQRSDNLDGKAVLGKRHERPIEQFMLILRRRRRTRLDQPTRVFGQIDP
jgi:hypothetical protein